MNLKGLNFTTFDDSITVYFKKSKSISDKFYYLYYINNKVVEKGYKTHYTFNNLTSQTKYEIKVEIYVKNKLVKTYLGTGTTKPTPNVIDVTKSPYNAVGDGVTLNTQAIQKAIDDCKKGERVYIPKGTFLTGALNLHSDMELYVEKGAILQGTTNEFDYLPKVNSRFEGYEMKCYRSLINIGTTTREKVYNCKNVVLRGGGTISGGSYVLAQNITLREKEELTEYIKSLGEKVKTFDSIDAIPGRARGRLICVANTNGVILSDLRLENGPAWTNHFIYSKNIVTQNCYIYSRPIHNGDGWNPDSSENCVIFGTGFETGDNCVAIKSGKNPEGNIINRPTIGVYIFDCVINSGGGFAIGSEMSGGVKDVYMWDVDATGGLLGVRIKAPTVRGGYIKNVEVLDSKLCDISITTKYFCNLDGDSAKTPTTFEDFYFENVYLTGISHFYYNMHSANGDMNKVLITEPKSRPIISIVGPNDDDNEIKNVTIKNCTILKRKIKDSQIIELDNIKNLQFTNVNFK